MFLCSEGRFSRCCYQQETQCAAKSPGLLQARVFLISSKERKGASVSAEENKASEKEFLMGASKSLFLGTCQFHFLSEASWETATFEFIYFIFMLLSFLFLF